MSILAVILPALAPAVVDLFKKAGEKIIGKKPLSVDDEIKLQQAEIEKLKALAELDKPADNISKWVADLRASARYLMGYLILLITAIAVFSKSVQPSHLDFLLTLSSSVFSFLFGDRVYTHLRGK